jgi:hypothetical protein
MNAATVGARRALAVMLACLTYFTAPPRALAQVDTGSIVGTVSDQTGAVLPGVTMTVTNLSTRQTRTVVTGSDGRYQVPGLQPATYSVAAELAGFTSVVHPQVTVNIGAAVDVNLIMRLATVQETVTVTGDAPLIESTKAEMSSVINQEQLEALPSKSRQYLDFTLLLPATVDSVSINQQGAGFSLGGARSSEAALLVDGFYNMDEGFALPKQRYSQDSIQEFQVVQFAGGAEYGRAIGGIVNGITKSGSNDVRGSAYGFFKDDSINAEETGARLRSVPKPPYSRQQWGGTLGGPLVHEKAFFFGAYERVKEDYTFDNGITPANAAAIGLPSNDVGTIPRYYRLNFAQGKVDYAATQNSRIQAGFAMSRWTEFNITSPTAFGSLSRQFNLESTDLSYLFKWTQVAGSGRAVHEVKFSYFPRDYAVTGLNDDGPPLVPAGGGINPARDNPESNSFPPRVNISSVASFGPVSVNDRELNYPIQTIYTSTVFADKHSLTFGADYQWSFFDYTLWQPLVGTYTFSSLANFQAGRYTQFTQSFGTGYMPRHHQYISAFVQDTWKAGDKTTINYGLRYDIEVQPMSATGQRFGSDYNNFGPRFSIAYDVTGRGTTLLKLASGIYYDRIFQNITAFYTNIKGYQTLVAATWTPSAPGAPVYPQVFTSRPSTLPAGVVDTNILPSKLQIPQSGQIVGTFEHALRPNLVVSASAIYNRSWHSDYRWDTNLAWDDATQRYVRIDSNYRQIVQYRFDTHAQYVGGIFEVKRRGTRAGANASLTLNRARNTGNNYATIPNDQRCGVDCDYGPQADTPTVRGVFSGWYNFTRLLQLSGVFQARGGMAVNPVAAGLDLNGDGQTGDRTPGFGRNSVRGPGFTQTDLRVTYRLPLQRARIDLYGEAFNVFNRDNVQSVHSDYGPTPGQSKVAFLQPTVYYPPFQAQLGLRLAF